MKKLILAMVLALLATRDARAGGCVISAATPLSFGTYNVYGGSNIDLQGTITYLCVVSLSVTMDLSTGSSATYAQRTLKSVANPSNTLGYQLYVDNTFGATKVWGDGNNGTKHYGPIIAVLTAVNVPVFARLPPGQDATVATDYQDTIVVTLNY